MQSDYESQDCPTNGWCGWPLGWCVRGKMGVNIKLFAIAKSACFPRPPYSRTLGYYKKEVSMIKKVVSKSKLPDYDEIKENLAFWQSKTKSERIAAVEHLRRQFHGNSNRLQRVIRIFQRP
jgi:hypothetical protein